MRFQVPQFINVEDKIFGPFTAKQFVYLAGGGAISYIIFKFLPIYLSVIIIAPLAILSLALAFAKPNGKPFVFLLEAGIKYYLGSKLYLWKKEPKKIKNTEENKSTIEVDNIISGGLSESRLKDLTWKLDINKDGGRKQPRV
jgi:membrane protein implicated in regulation of membrane protease activity